jgi:hypothetical protein
MNGDSSQEDAPDVADEEALQDWKGNATVLDQEEVERGCR